MDCIAIVSSQHKKTGSTEGHALAWTSPLQAARVADAPRRLDICRNAILNRDFATFADIIELEFRHDAFRNDDFESTADVLAVCHIGGFSSGA